MIYFQKIIWETELQRGRDRDKEREIKRKRSSISSICFFTFQMTIAAKAEPGQSQEPRAPSGSFVWVQGPENLDICWCFPRYLMRQLDWSEAAGKWTSTHMGCQHLSTFPIMSQYNTSPLFKNTWHAKTGQKWRYQDMRNGGIRNDSNFILDMFPFHSVSVMSM